MQVNLPVQAVVDRSVLLDMFMRSVYVRDKDGSVIQILKNPVGGPYGMMPGDLGWFSVSIDPRVLGCEMFRGHDAGRCAVRGRYF